MCWHQLWRVHVCVCAQIPRSGSRDRLVLQRNGFRLRVYSVTTLCTCVYASVYHISIQLPPHTLCKIALLCMVQKVTETITFVHNIHMYAKIMVSFTHHTRLYSDTRAHAHIFTPVCICTSNVLKVLTGQTTSAGFSSAGALYQGQIVLTMQVSPWRPMKLVLQLPQLLLCFYARSHTNTHTYTPTHDSQMFNLRLLKHFLSIFLLWDYVCVRCVRARHRECPNWLMLLLLLYKKQSSSFAGSSVCSKRRTDCHTDRWSQSFYQSAGITWALSSSSESS